MVIEIGTIYSYWTFLASDASARMAPSLAILAACDSSIRDLTKSTADLRSSDGRWRKTRLSPATARGLSSPPV